MKQFENKVLFIKDEAMLEEVENILGYKINGYQKDNDNKEFNYLSYQCDIDKFLFQTNWLKNPTMSFEQFKELLKQK